MLIRHATPADFSVLQDIELASFETLREAGAVVGEASASSNAELRRYLAQSLLYAACTPDGPPVGYCGGYVAEGWLHVGEMDVHPR